MVLSGQVKCGLGLGKCTCIACGHSYWATVLMVKQPSAGRQPASHCFGFSCANAYFSFLCCSSPILLFVCSLIIVVLKGRWEIPWTLPYILPTFFFTTSLSLGVHLLFFPFFLDSSLQCNAYNSDFSLNLHHHSFLALVEIHLRTDTILHSTDYILKVYWALIRAANLFNHKLI